MPDSFRSIPVFRRSPERRPAKRRIAWGCILAALLLAAVSAPPPAGAHEGSETDARPTTAHRHLVSSANPHASRAGLEILRAGGSAVDAAIAMQAVLGLVEPQSSGIGGGGFLLHFDAASGRIDAYDGRETAPAGIDETLFLDSEGRPMDYMDAALGGRAVGVPGVMAMLALAHEDHGRLPWARLFAPAIRLAEEGFRVSPRLHFLLARHAALFRKRGLKTADEVGPAGRYFFTPDLKAKPTGTLLKNPAYAETLRRIAREGVKVFYEGDIARDIVAAVRDNPLAPGALTLDDLKNYRAERDRPLCGSYRAWRICSMGPPSSGGSTMLAILGLLEGFDIGALPPWSLRALHLFAEAGRLAYADRDRYLADDRFVPVPLPGLIDRHYLARRRALIDPARAMEKAEPGIPPGAQAPGGRGEGPDHPSTSHLVAVDDAGNAVSFTTTVQIAFGSFVMTDGFLLNNQLTDFDFNPRDEHGRPVANRPAAGKKPRSSMTPTLVFDDEGRLRMAIGSPGGSRIIAYVTKTVIGVLDWKLDIQRAIALPNVVARGERVELEKGTPLQALMPGLSAMGHEVRMRTLNSGLHGFTVEYAADGTRTYVGGADPRREGVALGD